MILTGKEIKKQVKNGNIVIKPFDEECIKPNSYVYHLGDTLVEVLDVGDKKRKPKTRKIKIPQKGYVLEPKRLYLGTTVETIGSKEYVTSLIGRNRIAKLGMFLQITADLGQLGKEHRWTLEITVVQNLRIYPNMEIGQVTFWDTKGEKNIGDVEFYATKNEPFPSQLYNQKTK